MLLEKKISGVIPDNDLNFIRCIEGIINSIDEYSSGTVSSQPGYYLFRISPTYTRYINPLIKHLNEVNNYFGTTVEFSKSMKTSNNISFKIKTS